MRARAESVFRALAREDLQINVAGDPIRTTRREVVNGWRGAIDLLERSHPNLASGIRLFLESMPPAVTDQEYWQVDSKSKPDRSGGRRKH
jgi:hypothetical protein